MVSVHAHKPFQDLVQVQQRGGRLGADVLRDISPLCEECTRALYPVTVLQNMDRVDVFKRLRKALLYFNARLWINVVKPGAQHKRQDLQG